jgi:tRNA-specific 2-thiouridylase
MNGPFPKKKVAVGLSGGVDSSVSAHLLLQAGYDVVGVHMKCWDSKGDGCTADQDRADAVEVASKLGIEFRALDYVKEYNERVISYFYAEYEAGRTPNPDVMCNKEIKFGLFFDWAMQNGFDFVATGHYAQVRQNAGGVYELLRGVDDSKDQSYFLYLLDQERLSKVLFPVGHLPKKEVRLLAEALGLKTAAKPDSVGICFVGEVDIKEFLKKHIAAKVGVVRTLNGSAGICTSRAARASRCATGPPSPIAARSASRAGRRRWTSPAASPGPARRR